MSGAAASDSSRLGWALLSLVAAIVITAGLLLVRAAERRTMELSAPPPERPSPWKKTP